MFTSMSIHTKHFYTNGTSCYVNVIDFKKIILELRETELNKTITDVDINANVAFKLMRIIKELSSIIEDKNKINKYKKKKFFCNEIFRCVKLPI